MTLDEAIQHAEEKGQEGTPCAADHRQLAAWLKELRDYRRQEIPGLRPSTWPAGKTPC